MSKYTEETRSADWFFDVALPAAAKRFRDETGKEVVMTIREIDHTGKLTGILFKIAEKVTLFGCPIEIDDTLEEDEWYLKKTKI